jgi:hypothetical protein
MVKRPVIIAAAALLVLCAFDIASAQIAPPPNPWTHGTTLNVFAGAASASSETGPLAGGALGWQITPWVSVEGSGTWFNRRTGADAFAADLKALVNIIAARPVAPFVEGGIGMYRASFDSSRGLLPDFYRARTTGDMGNIGGITFTDPSFVVGGGVNMFVARHVAIRPDIEATIVRRNSQSYVVTSLSVHLAYHFEDFPMTPSGSR